MFVWNGPAGRRRTIELFNVRVEGVRTQNYMGKLARFKQIPGKQADWKKAIVTVHADDRIDFI